MSDPAAVSLEGVRASGVSIDLDEAHIAAELRPMARAISSLREDPKNAR